MVYWRRSATPYEAAVVYQEDGNDVIFTINNKITDLDMLLHELSVTCTTIAPRWRALNGGPAPKRITFRRGATLHGKPVTFEDRAGDLTYTVRPDLNLVEAFDAIGELVQYVVRRHYTRYGLRAVG
jgi:hypothetical protein